MATRWNFRITGLILTFLLTAPIARGDDETATEKYCFRVIDIQSHANQKLDNDFHTYPGNNLKLLPRGKQHLGEVDFLIGDKFVQLAGKMAPDYPERIDGILVNREVTKLHFLQGAGWVVGQGTPVGEYVIHYDDDTTAAIPIEYGLDVRDWWMYESDKKETPRAVIAWKGMNHASKNFQDQRISIRLYRRTWENPHPEKKVASFDYVSRNETQCSPFLVAVSAESSIPSEDEPFEQPATAQDESAGKPPAVEQVLSKEAMESIESLLDVSALLGVRRTATCDRSRTHHARADTGKATRNK